MRPSTRSADAGTVPPCARNWATVRSGNGGGSPRENTTRSAVITLTSSPVTGPTVTVPETGSMPSTYRGRPSGAGRKG